MPDLSANTQQMQFPDPVTELTTLQTSSWIGRRHMVRREGKGREDKVCTATLAFGSKLMPVPV